MLRVSQLVIAVNEQIEQGIREHIQTAIRADGRELSQLMADLHRELRQISRSQRRNGGVGETLSTTALVNEVFIKLSSSSDLFVHIDRNHFLAIAARAMRHIVINHARDKVAQKRGSGLALEELDANVHISEDLVEANRILELNSALERLDHLWPRLAEVVQLRYFAGLTETETGDVLNLGTSTVRRDWVKARGWLYEQLNPDADGNSNGPNRS